MSSLATIAAVAALLGSSLIAGVFFAFSSFIMKALASVPSSEGIAAMQSINVVVLNPAFLGTFVGTAALSIVIAVLAVTAWGTPSAAWFLMAASMYVGGTFLVTAFGNVPLNNQLASVSASDPSAVAIWKHYVDRWTFLNTIRTVAATVAAMMFLIGLLHRAGA